MSCYDFENFLRNILGCVKSGSKISAQIRNRLSFRNPVPVRNLVIQEPDISFTKNGKCSIQYQRFFIKFPSNNDSYILTKDKSVLQVLSLTKSSTRAKNIFLNCLVVEKCGSLYSSPILSADMGIYKLKPTAQRKICCVEDIVAKLFLLPYKGNFVCVPLLHTVRDDDV